MSESPSALDGRVLRGARSREAIVNAVFELIGEGFAQPTAEQVAKRAGVQVRTVFRHFADMETLYAQLSGRVEREMRPLLEQPSIEGGLDARVRALVARRCALYERIAPFKHSGALQRAHSPFLMRAAIASA